MNIVIILTVLVLSAWFWRKGGDGNKLYRWLGVSITCATGKSLLLLPLANVLTWKIVLVILYIPTLYLVLSLFSYGLNAPPHLLWVWIFKQPNDGNHFPTEVATRATVGFLWSFAAVPFALITGNWLGFIFYISFLTVANIGGLIKDVEISERWVGLAVACAVMV